MLSVALQQIIEGIFVKSVASFDDTLTRIPVLAQVTHSARGRIAFSMGTLLALTAIMSIANGFAQLLLVIPFSRQLIAGLIFLLALAVYFEIFNSGYENQVSQKVTQLSGRVAHLLKLTIIGFTISFVTLLDDMVILLPLFLEPDRTRYFALIGVYAATIFQVLVVIYLGKRLTHFPFKKEIATLSLMILSGLVAVGVV